MIKFATAIQLAGALIFGWWVWSQSIENAQLVQQVHCFQQSFDQQIQGLNDQLQTIELQTKGNKT